MNDALRFGGVEFGKGDWGFLRVKAVGRKEGEKGGRTKEGRTYAASQLESTTCGKKGGGVKFG